MYQEVTVTIKIRENSYTIFRITKTFYRYPMPNNLHNGNGIILTREGKIKECK